MINPVASSSTFAPTSAAEAQSLSGSEPTAQGTTGVSTPTITVPTRVAQGALAAKGPSVVTVPGLTPGAKDPLKPSVYGIGASFPVGLGWLIDRIGLDNVLRVLPPSVKRMALDQLRNLTVRIGVLPGTSPDALNDPSRLSKDTGVFVSVSLPGYPISYAMVINPGKGGFLGGIAKVWPVGPRGSDGMPNVLIFNNSYAGFSGLGTGDFRQRHMPGYVAVLGRIPFSDQARELLSNGIRALGTKAQVAGAVAVPGTGGASLVGVAWVQALKEIVAGTVESATYYAGVGWGTTTEIRDLNDWRFNLGGKLIKPEDAIPELTRQWRFHDGEVGQMVSTGAYQPAIALRRMFNFDPRHTNVVRDASLINQATQSAVAGGLADPKALGEQWVAVLEGRFNAGLSGRDLQAGKLLAATVLGRPQDITRLAQQLYPGAGLEGGMRPLGLPGSTSDDPRSALQRQNMPVGQVIAGHRVFDVRLVHRDIGHEVKRTGTGLQGSLMRGRTQGGTPVFWLQGQRTNYILRNPDGKLVTNLEQAEQRAKAYIRHGLASDLRPLDLRHVSPRVGAQATVGNTRSIDGVAIAGGVVSLGWVGGPVGNSNALARQGLLMWGRTPSGEARFWLQGIRNNYMLRDADGQFVADSVSATARAKDYIRHGLASDLRPLSLGALRAANGQVAVRQPLRLIDGMTIVGDVSSVTWVGAKVGQSDEGRQGLLHWGRTLGGDVVFWLRGLNEDRVLRDDRGALIANQAEAIERAKQLIQFEGMQNLHPLSLR